MKVLHHFEDANIDYAIIGGLARNVRFNLPSELKDIDIVVNSDSTDTILKEIKGYKYELNRLDGFKVFINAVVVDIWLLKNTFGIRKGLFENSWEGLLQSTVINYDSIILHNGKFEGYYTSFLDKGLDLISADSMFSSGNLLSSLVKCVRIYNQYHCLISDRLQYFLKLILDAYSYPRFLQEYAFQTKSNQANFELPMFLKKKNLAILNNTNILIDKRILSLSLSRAFIVA